jgi:hypothetical protein
MPTSRHASLSLLVASLAAAQAPGRPGLPPPQFGDNPDAFPERIQIVALNGEVLLGLPHGRPEPAPASDPAAEDGASIPAGGWRRVLAAAPGPIVLDAATAVAVAGCPC